MKDIYDIIREWKKRPDEKLALATLVRAEGSSYRRPGARMLICEDGAIVGSLSAGCLEEEVALHGREVLQTGQSQLLTFDTRRRFGCAGKIDIFIERASDRFLAGIAEHLDTRRVCRVVTIFRGGNTGSETVSGVGFQPMGHRQDADVTDAFMQEIHPPIRLSIIGDGVDSAPLHSLGHLLGWDTVEMADANKLSIDPDEWTAAIVKSHNYGRDFVALQKLLPLDLGYVGLIGPRKRRDQLLNDLLDLGITINAGFFAPAGLDFAAETPEEIALAIVSEIRCVFGGGSGTSLRECKVAIHAPTKMVPCA